MHSQGNWQQQIRQTRTFMFSKPQQTPNRTVFQIVHLYGNERLQQIAEYGKKTAPPELRYDERHTVSSTTEKKNTLN